MEITLVVLESWMHKISQLNVPLRMEGTKMTEGQFMLKAGKLFEIASAN